MLQELSQTARSDVDEERVDESEQRAGARPRMQGVVERRTMSGRVSLCSPSRPSPCCRRCPFLFHMRDPRRLHACQTHFICPPKPSKPIHPITYTRRKTCTTTPLLANSICSRASVLSLWLQLVKTTAPP